MIDKKSILEYIGNDNLNLVYNKDLGSWFFYYDIHKHDTLATKLTDMDLHQWKEEANFFLSKT